jgi:cytochrome c oxidase cbb3-type subunit 2
MSARVKFIFAFMLLTASIIALYAFVGSRGTDSGGMGMMIGDMSKMKLWLRGETLTIDLNSPRPLENDSSIRVGGAIYGRRCAVCHGLKGDGNGEKAGDLQTKPRDFRFGTYKFRSTPTGSLPTDEDLFKTISRGLHGTSMLPWLGLTTSDKWSVVYYIKSFCDFFEEGEKIEVVKFPGPAESGDEYAEQGKSVYKKAKCRECHGNQGRGDGPTADKLRDDWGLPIRPRNFVEEILKRGIDVEEIYLTIATGLDGTPMPSYSTALTKDEIVAVSYYIRSLAPDIRGSKQENSNQDVKTGMELMMMQSDIFDESGGEVLLGIGIAILGLIIFIRMRGFKTS